MVTAVRQVWRALALLSCAAALAAAREADAHPIHSTLTEITRRPDGGVTLRIRAFADDFSAAASRLAGVPPSPSHAVNDAAAFRYLDRFVRLEDAGGRVVRLSLVRQRREGDVVWLELCGESVPDLAALRFRNALLFDLHADQVNVVQSEHAGVKRTILFTKGDGARRLR